MRKTLAALLSGLAVFTGISLMAQDTNPDGRVDISGLDEQIEIIPGNIPENCESSDATSWMDENGKCYRIFSFTGSTTDWTKSEFSFKPSKAGTVQIILRGNYFPKGEGSQELIPAWEYITNITVDGAKIKNGDFSELEDGKPASWNLEDNAEYVSDKSQLPIDSKGAVKVWHNAPASQEIDVQAGTEVKISFMHKGVK